MNTNIIHCGDNLEIMRGMDSESVDLLYADPPFFSGCNYDVICEGEGDYSEIRSFKDTEWYRVQCPNCDREVVKADRFCPACGASLEHAKVVSKNDIYAYIDWMIPRLREMKMILKPTGSIYLHCDWHASAYLKIEMDRIFGMKNFRNEIVWHYQNKIGKPLTSCKRSHDTILFYTKSSDYTYNSILVEIDNELTLKRYDHEDKNGIYKIYHTGGVDRKVYLKPKVSDDVWSINILSANNKERLGYPTQKPEALLERIIKASSNPGDIVFDPFAGCGTTMAVAQKLGRKWIGIDVSPTACTAITKHINIPIWKIEDMPMTTDELEKLESNEFQQWVCTRMEAKNTIPDAPRHSGADVGIDGIVRSTNFTTGYAGAYIEAKRQRSIGPDLVVQLQNVMRKDNVKYGFVVALSFGKGAIEQAKEFKTSGVCDIKLILAEDIAEKGYFTEV